ncbi:MAG: hypothetical protein GX810_07965, partial [Clostridiales bacterium]|nr:hypothetical protein [Clostridiales bacterium]
MAKAFALLLACTLLCGSALAQDLTLTEDEVNQLLYEVHAQEEASAGSFLVLPEGYEEPAIGYDGVYH